MKKLGLQFTSSQVAEAFAARQDNRKHRQLAEVLALVGVESIKAIPGPIAIVELTADAHPDRYNALWERIKKSGGEVHWVNPSEHILGEAAVYLHKNNPEREDDLHFDEKTNTEFLLKQADASLDLVLMRYALAFEDDLGTLFRLLNNKLSKDGAFVASLTTLDGRIPSKTSNGRFLYQGREFEDDENVMLKNQEEFEVKFFNEYKKPDSGYMQGVKAHGIFHHPDEIIEIADASGLDAWIGDWKDIVPTEQHHDIEWNQNVLVIRKGTE